MIHNKVHCLAGDCENIVSEYAISVENTKCWSSPFVTESINILGTLIIRFMQSIYNVQTWMSYDKCLVLELELSLYRDNFRRRSKVGWRQGRVKWTEGKAFPSNLPFCGPLKQRTNNNIRNPFRKIYLHLNEIDVIHNEYSVYFKPSKSVYFNIFKYYR